MMKFLILFVLFGNMAFSAGVFDGPSENDRVCTGLKKPSSSTKRPTSNNTTEDMLKESRKRREASSRSRSGNTSKPSSSSNKYDERITEKIKEVINTTLERNSENKIIGITTKHTVNGSFKAGLMRQELTKKCASYNKASKYKATFKTERNKDPKKSYEIFFYFTVLKK
jgi:hypothetical protein